MTYETDVATIRTSRWRIRRSMGATSGMLLILLGAWGAVIPFVGPYFDYAFTPDTTWTWTSGRFWLEVLPGIATAVGGFMLVVAANRGTAGLGGWLAAAAGAWFAVGPVLTPLWDPGTLGRPLGGSTRQALEWVGFHYGLGVVVVFLAAGALGRLTVRDARLAEAVPGRHVGREAPRERSDVEPPASPDYEIYPSDAEKAGRRDEPTAAPGAGTRPAAE
jgi:hypothetical protein